MTTLTTTRIPISASHVTRYLKHIHMMMYRQNHGRCMSTTNSDTSTSATPKIVYNSHSRIVDVERDHVNDLVDRLMERTRHLMITTHRVDEDNKNISESSQNRSVVKQFHHTIAYSGGIDSSLVAAVVYQISRDLNEVGSSNCMSATATLPPQQQHNVTAVLGISPAVSMEQIRQAEDVALHIGIPFVKIPTEEGKNETYIANNGQACFACKSELYTKLIHHTIANYTTQPQMDAVSEPLLQPHSMLDNNNHRYQKLYNGTNADDCLDPTRVGLIAASQYNVISPLSTITKEQVRLIAKQLQLPNWNVASNPCLRSRLAIGIPATKQHLQRIERAERYIRQQLIDIITVETNLRVRLLPQQRGCLEIDATFVDAATNLYHAHQQEWDEVLLQELQFRSFTIRSFRSGSVAATIAPSLSVLTNESPSLITTTS